MYEQKFMVLLLLHTVINFPNLKRKTNLWDAVSVYVMNVYVSEIAKGDDR